MSVITIGLDLAKSVFQVHGVDASAHAVIRRRLGRGDLLPLFAKQPSCVVGMEACSSARPSVVLLDSRLRSASAQLLIEASTGTARAWRSSLRK